MADKSFGVKELNLLNASGTPTVTSPNNLNLNANTVAISTSCTIGNNLTVTSTTNSANLNVTGIGTLTRAFATDLSVSGVTTITVPANANPHSSWDVVNNSASAYRFTGPGQDGAEDNPNIYLVRGQRYVFKMNASGHPFQIRVANGGAAYSDGVTNNGAQTGNVVFNVQHDAPAQLYYQCTSHGGMVGNIYIVGQHLANGANNRVLTATSAYGINAEANLTFDGTTLKAETGNPFLELSGTTSNGGNTGIHINANANHWVLESDNYTSQNLFSIKDGTPDSSTARLVIDSSGNTTISSGNLVIGTSGKGIDFSAQTTSSAGGVVVQSEKITHFEEGIYVPTIACNTSGSITLNTSYNKLSYTRINNTVTVYGRVRVSAVSSPNGQQLRIGLPFTSDVLTGYGDAGRVFGYARLGNAAQDQYYYGISATGGNNDFVQIHRIDENNDNPANVCADVDSNTRIAVSFTYRAQ